MPTLAIALYALALAIRWPCPDSAIAVPDRPLLVAPRLGRHRHFRRAQQVLHSRFSPCRDRRKASPPGPSRRCREGDSARAWPLTRTPEGPLQVARLRATSHPESRAL